ncbi:unnamed protein product, partial [Iphiclides podalirius]
MIKKGFMAPDQNISRDVQCATCVMPSLVVFILLTVLDLCVPLYHDQFALHIPDGSSYADDLAHRHGFINHGQIGNLKNFFLFSHPLISKRSLNASTDYVHRLKNDPQVRWVMQQRELKRRKRDHQWKPRHVARQSIAPSFPDPLFKEQWYLNGGAAGGLDMNVGYAWRKGYTGKGVVITILDDGIQPNHPDLIQNYDPAASTDINGNDTDPTPQDNGDNKHGTRCAGEVAAVAYNKYCGVGIAYNASIGGVRMLDGLVNDAVEAQALGFNTHHIDIYSASWGPEDDGKTVDGPGPLARRAFINGVTNGRGGKGSIFIWASGNGGRHTDSCNCDGYANSIFTISISSATQEEVTVTIFRQHKEKTYSPMLMTNKYKECVTQNVILKDAMERDQHNALHTIRKENVYRVLWDVLYAHILCVHCVKRNGPLRRVESVFPMVVINVILANTLRQAVAKTATPLVRNVAGLMSGTVYLAQAHYYCRARGASQNVALGALRLQSGTCREICAPGYYPDDGICSKCYLSCQTCTGPRRDQCASCPPDWRLAAGECRPECPQNFFTWGDSCRRCHHYCQDCHGAGPQRCTSCPQHFSLENGLCIECLSSQYYEPMSRTCRQCHESCRSCSGPGPTNCVTCAHPLRLDRVNHKCLPCCMENVSSMFLIPNLTNDCCHCDKDVGGCLNGSSAGKRRIAENVRTHLTASFFVDDGKDPPKILQLDRNLLIAWCVGAVVGLIVATVLVLMLRSKKKKHLRLYPRTLYSQLTTVDDDLVRLATSTTKLKVMPAENVEMTSTTEEPT